MQWHIFWNPSDSFRTSTLKIGLYIFRKYVELIYFDQNYTLTLKKTINAFLKISWDLRTTHPLTIYTFQTRCSKEKLFKITKTIKKSAHLPIWERTLYTCLSFSIQWSQKSKWTKMNKHNISYKITPAILKNFQQTELLDSNKHELKTVGKPGVQWRKLEETEGEGGWRRRRKTDESLMKRNSSKLHYFFFMKLAIFWLLERLYI